MRMIGFAGALALASLACQKKEEASSAKPAASEPAGGASSAAPAPDEKKEEAPASKPTKAGERPAVTEKKIPVAEPLPDKPGYVKSPFSGQIIDVKGIPAGTLVADPMFPVEEKKHFRVPKMSPENEAKAKEEELLQELIESAKENAPVGELIADKPGFIVSPYGKAEANDGPYDRVTIDATGLEPGSVIEDPSSTPEAPRFFKVPGGE